MGCFASAFGGEAVFVVSVPILQKMRFDIKKTTRLIYIFFIVNSLFYYFMMFYFSFFCQCDSKTEATLNGQPGFKLVVVVVVVVVLLISCPCVRMCCNV